MLIATILCWVSWFFVLFTVDPFQENTVGFSLFYLSLFFALLGTISLISFGVYRYSTSAVLPMYRYVKKSFRKGVALAGMIIFLLYLQEHALLHIWNLSIFFVVLVLIFLFSISTNGSRSSVGHPVLK